MNVKRFFGRTNKDALARLRAELGPEAIVLKNRIVDGGVEILAMADHATLGAPAVEEPVRAPAEEADAAVPEMTTMSFQQYVRDRLARRGSRATPSTARAAGAEPGSAAPPASARASGPAPTPAGPPAAPVVVAPSRPAEVEAPARRVERSEPAEDALNDLFDDSPGENDPMLARPAPARASVAGGRGTRRHAIETPVARAVHTGRVPERALSPSELEQALGGARESITEAVQAAMLAEMQQMKRFIAEQLESLSWFETTRREPARARLLRTLVGAGYSSALSRAIVDRVPAGLDEHEAQVWAAKALSRNLAADSEGSLLEGGGIFALIGPTGVGKTTSTAKIAARFALKHGAQSVGLVTVDAYRIGGQDQLRSFGRMLGVPVHVAHDPASLADFLHLTMNKKLVLIDTAGIGQRDERVDELLASLSSTVIRRLLVLNAAAQASTQEEVIAAYQGAQAAGLILSKLDEAVQCAGALDCAIRHRLRVVGVANGQRVPEDWSNADPQALVAQSLASPGAPAFELDEQLLGMLFSQSRQAAAAGVRRSDV